MLPSRLLNENITNETYYTTNETYFPTVTPTAGVYIANADSTMNKESYFPSMAPTPVDYVSSNDSSIIKETFRVYGSLYLFFFLMFCYVRPKFPKYYNIRSWVPELKCDLAVNQTYGVISWCWQVLSVPDDDLLKSCGMDALCFIRCLRFGAKLSLLGSVMASWLIPLYWTAEESEETKHLTDKFVLMSIASLPIKSPRFVGPVVAMYFIILYSMHLITKELKWFCCMRHKFLSQRVPRNYACYVSGIPSEYRSSYKLADYFQQNSGKASVLEAHVAMDIPLLEAKVARREKVVKKLEHAIALERKKGVTLTHVSLKLQDGINAIKKENTVDALRKELDSLNRKIPRSVGEILQDHDRFKSNLKKTKTRGSIALQLAVIDDDKSTHSDSNDQGKERLSIEWDGDSNYDSSTSGLGGPQGSMEESAFKSDDSNDSQLQESGTHPFLSMLGLDSFVFHQNNGTLEQFLMGNSDTGEAINQAQVSDVENGCMLEESNASVKSTTPQEKVPGEFIVERSQGGSASTKVTSTQSISGGDIEQPKGPKQNIVNNHQSSSQRRSKQSSMMLPIQSTMALHARKVGSISMQGAKKVGSRTKVVGSAVKKAIQDVNTEAVAANLKKVGTIGVQGVKTAGSMGVARMIKAADLGIQNAAAVVPLRIKKEEGKPREAGFVVFSDLYTTHAARQMLQHPSAKNIFVEPAPDPDEIFWRNVGLPDKARRSGRLLSLVATSTLCFFWSIPTSFLSSLTEVNSLKEKLPALEEWIEKFPFLESFLALIAPLVLLILNDNLLPIMLKAFATWEGHVSSPVLEASLFVKLCSFTLIQTFFVSAVSGTVAAEISNILDDPKSIMDILANSLPAQSSYFIQICLVFTFLLQGMSLLRCNELGFAFCRRMIGPKLTAKERRTTWNMFNSLEDPPEFWHAELTSQLVLFFVVFFVYAVIAPVTSIFLGVCFIVCESGYRYHFIHNHKTFPDSGGVLWQGFLNVLMASMLIGQLTLVGLLVLKQTVYAVPVLLPLLALTVLFMIYVIPKRIHVANHLPAMLCVEMDRKNREQENANARFTARRYLQPALQSRNFVYPDEDEDL